LPLSIISSWPPPFVIAIQLIIRLCHVEHFFYLWSIPRHHLWLGDLISTPSLPSSCLPSSHFPSSFICYSNHKSNSHHLQRFNSLWSVRFLLVFIITLWGLNELFRLPFFSFFNHITTRKHMQIPRCFLIGVILEPGFLVIFLFIVKFSIKRRVYC